MLLDQITGSQDETLPAAPPGQLYAQALGLLHAHANDRTTINEILGSLCVSRTTLRRHFLAHLQRTPVAELTRIRVARARELLGHAGLSIKQIALLTGYRRPSHFCDFFRRHTGLSPRAFRQGQTRATTKGAGNYLAAALGAGRKDAMKECKKTRKPPGARR